MKVQELINQLTAAMTVVGNVDVLISQDMAPGLDFQVVGHAQTPEKYQTVWLVPENDGMAPHGV